MNKTMIASIAALLATSSLAFAHGHGHARFDRDGNGIVTRDEMRTTETERFDKIDANRDGQLTRDEIQAFAKEHLAKHFAHKNKDGKSLTPEELQKKQEHFQEHAARRFAHNDTDGNGTISRDEALAQVDKRFARMDPTATASSPWRS